MTISMESIEMAVDGIFKTMSSLDFTPSTPTPSPNPIPSPKRLCPPPLSLPPSSPPAPPSTSTSHPSLSDFKRFWECYPRRVGRKAAYRAWLKYFRIMPPIEQVLAVVEGWKKSNDWRKPAYIPHPTTWLNRGGWEDDIPTDVALVTGEMSEFEKFAVAKLDRLVIEVSGGEVHPDEKVELLVAAREFLTAYKRLPQDPIYKVHIPGARKLVEEYCHWAKDRYKNGAKWFGPFAIGPRYKDWSKFLRHLNQKMGV